MGGEQSRARALRYGPPLVLALALYKHFQPASSKKRQQKRRLDRDDAGGDTGEEASGPVGTQGQGQGPGLRRSKVGKKKYVTSLLFAARSTTLRNMLASAVVVSLLSKRALGLSPRRMFPAFFATIWALVYWFRVVETPRVWYKRTYFLTALVEKSRLTQTEFWPVFWGFNRHSQTVVLFVVSALEWLWATPINFRRETIPCYDPPNEQYIDWATYDVPSRLPGHKDAHLGDGDGDLDDDPTATTWQTPVIICIHGLGDNKDIPYMKRFMRTCLKKGWRVAVWSYWRFEFEESRDLKLLVDHIHTKYPRAPIVGVAWSAGAYYLSRYLQKAGGDTPMVAAICQSGCLDFVQACEDVTHNENTTYPLFLLGQAHVGIRRHIANDKRITDKSRFDKIFYEDADPLRLYNSFYSLLPEPIHDATQRYGPEGFVVDTGTLLERVRNAPHYVARSIDRMDQIKVTTLLLHADDDPIVSPDHVDWTKVQGNRHIIVAHTHRGGHVAWHEGLMPFGTTWGDRVSSNYISAVMESISQTQFFVNLVRQATSSAPFNGGGGLGGGGLGGGGGGGFGFASGSAAFTPKAMARIVSASDLASMSLANPAIDRRDSFTSDSERENRIF